MTGILIDRSVSIVDPAMAEALMRELARQLDTLEMCP